MQGSSGDGAGSCSALSDRKCESFSLQVFSCRVPGLCTHLPFPTTCLFISLRAPVQHSHLHLMRDREGCSSLSSPCCLRAGAWRRPAHAPLRRWEHGGSHPEPHLMGPLEMMQLCLPLFSRWAPLAPPYPLLGVKETKRVLQLVVGVLESGEETVCSPGPRLGKRFPPGHSTAPQGRAEVLGTPLKAAPNNSSGSPRCRERVCLLLGRESPRRAGVPYIWSRVLVRPM